MTTDPSSSLVERVAAAMRTAFGADRPHRAYHITERDVLNATRAAIRVVVEACAEVCDKRAAYLVERGDGADAAMGRPADATPNRYHLTAGTVATMAKAIRNLAPKDTP